MEKYRITIKILIIPSTTKKLKIGTQKDKMGAVSISPPPNMMV
jgi:hypothetical protein